MLVSMGAQNLYIVPAEVPGRVAKVGWDRRWQSYWFTIYAKGPFGETEVTDPEVFFTMGVEGAVEQITNVGDLLKITWGEIDWETPEGLYAIRALRDDPIYEAAWECPDVYGPAVDEDFDNFLLHAFDSQAITKANEAMSGRPEPMSPAPTALRNQAPKPVPTTETRMPASHRRFFRRRNSA